MDLNVGIWIYPSMASDLNKCTFEIFKMTQKYVRCGNDYQTMQFEWTTISFHLFHFAAKPDTHDDKPVSQIPRFAAYLAARKKQAEENKKPFTPGMYPLICKNF